MTVKKSTEIFNQLFRIKKMSKYTFILFGMWHFAKYAMKPRSCRNAIQIILLKYIADECYTF